MTASDDNVIVDASQAPPCATTGRIEGLRAQILRVLYLHRLLFGLVALYWAGCAAVFLFVWDTVFTGRELLFWLSIITSATFCFFTVNLLVWLASWLVPRKYSGALRDQIKYQATYSRLLLAIPVFLLYCPFAAAFAKFKLLIPTFHPFAFDAALAHIDRALHAGIDPWRWLAPVFLNAPGIEIISLLYNLAWMGVMFYVLAHVSLNTRELPRMQFLYSFFGCWVLLGTFGAMALSSAGPVFYERVVGEPGPYVALFSQLAQFSAHGWFTPAPISVMRGRLMQHPESSTSRWVYRPCPACIFPSPCSSFSMPAVSAPCWPGWQVFTWCLLSSVRSSWAGTMRWTGMRRSLARLSFGG